MKKKLAATLSVVLILGLAVLGILAYLSDTDSDVNVMTLGNVSIEQIEQERDANGNLKDFTQEKPLYPAVYSGETLTWDDEKVDVNGVGYKVFDESMKNVLDKIVTVKNTGKSDAYVRTVIAFEAPEDFNDNLLHINWNSTGVVMSDWVYAVVDGNRYVVASFTYTDALASGAVSAPSLMQVYLDPAATNEDVEACDGNENGTYDILVLSQAGQTNGFDDAETALNTMFGEMKVNAAKWFAEVLAEHAVSVWNGTADTSWYDPANPQSEYSIETAEQLAGLADLVDDGNTFEGKTIYLEKNIDLDNKLFDPIGSYRNDTSFKGTFDGKEYTISNLSQNTWELDNGYYYSDCGLGLFGAVEEGIVKNLVIDGASISGESALCGVVAAVAHNATFENITVNNSEAADYQYYAGGIVGWGSGELTFEECNVEESTTIAAQWGDFDNSTGGVIGGASGSAKILLKDCDVACRIDAYNDVTSSYQWYAYRRAGMLIGNTGKTDTRADGNKIAAAPQLTCENVTVTYGDWANYTYCEFAGKNWPYVRVQAGVSNSAYSNPRYGHPIDANGKEVIDDNHVHNAGEDHQILCVFDQLYGGGQGVYGNPTHDGVTVIYNNK